MYRGGRGSRIGHGARFGGRRGYSGSLTKTLFEHAESEVSDLSDISSTALTSLDLREESSMMKVRVFLCSLCNWYLIMFGSLKS